MNCALAPVEDKSVSGFSSKLLKKIGTYDIWALKLNLHNNEVIVG